MLRLAPVRAWVLASLNNPPATLGLTALALSVLVACNDPPSPQPTKLAAGAAKSAAPLPIEKPPPAGPSPFYHPDREAPPPRSEPQLPADQLAAALAGAAEALKVGDEVSATLKLRPCANKVPQSIRCEGELAMLLIKQRRHAAEARYYIEQALLADDPALDDTYHRRFGAAMMAQGLAKEAAVSFERMMSRIKPTAADWYLLSTALQGVPERLGEAADAAGKAYELDPTRHEWLREQAILLGQIPDKIAQAIALFETYRGKVDDPATIADIDRRIAELRTIKPEDAALAAAKGKRKKVARTPTPG